MLRPGEANLAPPWSPPPITMGESKAKGGGIWGSSCTEICIAIAIIMNNPKHKYQNKFGILVTSLMTSSFVFSYSHSYSHPYSHSCSHSYSHRYSLGFDVYMGRDTTFTLHSLLLSPLLSGDFGQSLIARVINDSRRNFESKDDSKSESRRKQRMTSSVTSLVCQIYFGTYV